MKNHVLYNGMLGSLQKVRLNNRDRARAERQLGRAAVLVDMLLGSLQTEELAAQGEEIHAAVPPSESQEYRAAA